MKEALNFYIKHEIFIFWIYSITYCWILRDLVSFKFLKLIFDIKLVLLIYELCLGCALKVIQTGRFIAWTINQQISIAPL